MRRAACSLLLIIASAACDPGPVPPVPSSPDSRDQDYRRDWFPSDADEPFPLDRAILENKLDEVRRLLEQGANPNLRWGQSGDHFPLQEILDSPGGMSDPAEAIRLLLSHGAEPNAKWCPFESRGGRAEWGPSCTSARGSTAIQFAAVYDRVEMVELLLRAGADPAVRDWANGSALDYAYDEIVFETISRALFPEIASRDPEALAWLKEYDGRWYGTNAWESTPLSRALAQIDGGRVPPPPSPLSIEAGHYSERRHRAERESRLLGRVRTLLRIGADPNERATRGGADWTPIGMAVWQGALRAARYLLQNGADPNLRTCVDFVYGSFRAITTHGPVFRKDPACTIKNGRTPLMYSAGRGDRDAVTLLLEFNADRSLKDLAGRSAIDYAGTPEIRELLKAR